MPRERLYRNQAERQAAYRARHAERKQPRQDLLARLASKLHYVLGEAIAADKCPLPHELLGSRADETMKNFLYYLDPEPDPIRYYGMEGKPKA